MLTKEIFVAYSEELFLNQFKNKVILDQAASKMKTETESAFSWTAVNQACVLQRFKLPKIAFRSFFTQPNCPTQTQLSCVFGKGQQASSQNCLRMDTSLKCYFSCPAYNTNSNYSEAELYFLQQWKPFILFLNLIQLCAEAAVKKSFSSRSRKFIYKT